ncbi:MAG: hypothetical protein [Olavius algarvensis Gamma 1 endosymbiont]|nr:MAG: hypothetical protein [Olavius algarvensis Gamma 1 endosymbiont]
MRVGAALRTLGVDLSGLATCVNYNRNRFSSHAPGHVRSAQDLANRFYRKPNAHGLGANSFESFTGSIKRNMAELKDRKGMIFIMNGWGNTDHIDIWKGNGVTGILKGGFTRYFTVGAEVWFWDFD